VFAAVESIFLAWSTSGGHDCADDTTGAIAIAIPAMTDIQLFMVRYSSRHTPSRGPVGADG
jgi:hypothetical protein